jgi:hypothetical protein
VLPERVKANGKSYVVKSISGFGSWEGTKVTIPRTVEFIGEKCFCRELEASRLNEVIFEKDSCLKKIGRLAFYGSGLKTIEIPEKCEFLEGALCGVKFVSVSSSNPFIDVEGDFVITKDKKKLLHYFGCSLRIVIPNSVEIIGERCFSETSLNEVIFESGCNLKGIESAAFVSTRLKSIRIPSKVEFIGEGCFSHCDSLNEVIFESGCNLTRIEKSAFSFSGLKSIRIPSKVEFIVEGCFADCESLNEVIFEGEVKIGKGAFENSPVRLVKVPVGVKLNYSFDKDCRIEYVGKKVVAETERRNISEWIIRLKEEYEEDQEWKSEGGQMKLFRNGKTGEEVAVKSLVLKAGENEEKVQEDFIGEVSSLIELNHPCIVSLKGCCLPMNGEGPTILTEFLGGSLKSVLVSWKFPRWWTATRKAKTIC